MKEKEIEITYEMVLSRHPELDIVQQRPEDRTQTTIKSYVLRAQKLGKGQLEALYHHYDDYCLTYRESPLDIAAVFGNTNPLVIEIGFGMGESTIAIAKANPQINYLGFEVFINGFSKVLSVISKQRIPNLRIMRFDAQAAISTMIPDGGVSGFHIFFPDPWPKKRHHQRRLVQDRFCAVMSSKLRKGGYVYAVTDWEDYAEQMLEVLSGTDGLVNGYPGYAEPIPWRPQTCFERKGLSKDYVIRELWFEKV